MNKDIIFNFLLDIRKKKIDPFTRAETIDKYIIDNKISQRELARQLGIPHNTIQDWCLWTRLKREEYDKLVSDGLSHSDIYRLLRNNKKEEKTEMLKISKIEIELENTISFLNKNIKSIDNSENTKKLILELQQILNRMINFIEKGKNING